MTASKELLEMTLKSDGFFFNIPWPSAAAPAMKSLAVRGGGLEGYFSAIDQYQFL